MACSKETDNFYRFNSLILDNGRQSIVLLLEYYLSNFKNITFEQFINNNQHDILHLCYTSVTCCQCQRNCKLKYQNQILYSSQLEVILEQYGTRLPCHKQRSYIQEFCCCKAKPGLSTDVLDVTLAYSLLVNFCEDAFWMCLLSHQGKTFEMFLDDKKHDIYHLAITNQTCCLCTHGYVMPKSKGKLKDPRLTWAKCYSGSSPPCNKHRNCVNGPSSTCPCTAGATPGILPSMLNPRDSEYLLSTFCETRKSVEILREHRNKQTHKFSESMPDQIYLSSNKATRTAIKRIAQVCGKEEEVKRALNELDERPLDHYLFKQHHMQMLQLVLKELERNKRLPVLISEGIQNANQNYKKIQIMLRTNLERLNDIVSSTINMSPDEIQRVKSVMVDLKNHLEENSISSIMSNPRLQRNVQDLDSCIDVVLTEVSNFPAINDELEEIYHEVIEEVEILKCLSKDGKSIEDILKNKVTLVIASNMKAEYKATVSCFVEQLVYIIGVGIRRMTPIDLNQLLQSVKLHNRNPLMMTMRDDLKVKMKNVARENFIEIMELLMPYQYLCAIWKVLVLYLSCIFDVSSCHDNMNIDGVQNVVKYARSEDIKLKQCFVEPTKKHNALYVFLYNRSDWQPMQIFVNNISCSPRRNNNLLEGRYNIFPATFRNSYIHMTKFFSFLRCSSGNQKFMQFRFELVDEEESQFHIFLVGSQNMYLRMGSKFCVRIINGNPQGDHKAIWKIVNISDMGPNCYMLATKASKDSLLTFVEFGRVCGSKSQPNDKHLWILDVVQVGSNSI